MVFFFPGIAQPALIPSVHYVHTSTCIWERGIPSTFCKAWTSLGHQYTATFSGSWVFERRLNMYVWVSRPLQERLKKNGGSSQVTSSDPAYAGLKGPSYRRHISRTRSVSSPLEKLDGPLLVPILWLTCGDLWCHPGHTPQGRGMSQGRPHR